jgi:hypothetical protein
VLFDYVFLHRDKPTIRPFFEWQEAGVTLPEALRGGATPALEGCEERGLDPKKIFYETQKARVRLVRLLEAIEGSVGARPGARLQVDFRGTESLEETIATASRRLSFALGLGGALVGAAMTADPARAPRWVPALMGTVGSALAARLLMDRSRRRG